MKKISKTLVITGIMAVLAGGSMFAKTTLKLADGSISVSVKPAIEVSATEKTTGPKPINVSYKQEVKKAPAPVAAPAKVEAKKTPTPRDCNKKDCTVASHHHKKPVAVKDNHDYKYKDNQYRKDKDNYKKVSYNPNCKNNGKTNTTAKKTETNKNNQVKNKNNGGKTVTTTTTTTTTVVTTTTTKKNNNAK